MHIVKSDWLKPIYQFDAIITNYSFTDSYIQIITIMFQKMEKKFYFGKKSSMIIDILFYVQYLYIAHNNSPSKRPKKKKHWNRNRMRY